MTETDKMKSTKQVKNVTCLIYTTEVPRKFDGKLLGHIDLHKIHILVDSTGNLLKEPMANAESKMRKFCESQDMSIINSTLHKPSLLVIEVDTTKNPVYEQTNWRDIQANDESLCWRTILWPTTSNTTDECLGFASIGKKDSLGGPYTVTNIMPFVLKATD